MKKMKIYDAFETKTTAKKLAEDLRKQGVQYVRVRPYNHPRLKWAIWLGGKNSSYY